MKCPNCGAEVKGTKFCEYCGSQITVDMQKEQEQLNKKGCPKCGSTNITFKRENQGEVRGKNAKQVIHRTVGVCKDCGNTWFVDNEPKKKKTWLWVLGWIFIFPVPLTILLLRKKDMNKYLKYGIIAVAWIVYLIIGFSGAGNNAETTTPTTDANAPATVIELVAGEAGEYGKEITMSADEGKIIVYYVPAGTYTVKNLGENRTQVTVYEATKNSKTGFYEYSEEKEPIIAMLDKDGEDEIEVPEGWFIEIHEPAHISLTAK